MRDGGMRRRDGGMRTRTRTLERIDTNINAMTFVSRV